MKKLLFLHSVLLFFVLTLSACGDDDLIGIGGTPPEFTIEKHQFAAAGGNIVTKQTKLEKWIITSIYTSPSEQGDIVIKNGNITSNGYEDYVGSWYRVKRVGNDSIEITVDSNTTGKERTLIVMTSPYDNLDTNKTLFFTQEG